MRLHRRLTTIIAAGCLALTTAGCGGGGEPAPNPSTSTSKLAESKAATTKTAEPNINAGETSSPSARHDIPKPTRADYRHINEKNEAGATDALSYFVEGYRYSLITRDPSIIEEMSGPDCNSCREMIADIRKEPRKFSEINWMIADKFVEFESENVAPTAFTIHSKATPLDPKKSALVVETIYIGGKMTWIDGRWVVNNGSVELEDE